MTAACCTLKYVNCETRGVIPVLRCTQVFTRSLAAARENGAARRPMAPIGQPIVSQFLCFVIPDVFCYPSRSAGSQHSALARRIDNQNDQRAIYGVPTVGSVRFVGGAHTNLQREGSVLTAVSILRFFSGIHVGVTRNTRGNLLVRQGAATGSENLAP